jgi:hypothetical protein
MERLIGLMPNVLKDLAANDAVDEAVALAAWPQSAGDMVAERTRALEFFENRLIVAVRDETWRRHLEDLSPVLIAKLNASLGPGSVRFVEFRVSRKAFADEEKPRGNTRELVSLPPSVVVAADAITDDLLRERFLTAASINVAPDNPGPNSELETLN